MRTRTGRLSAASALGAVFVLGMVVGGGLLAGDGARAARSSATVCSNADLDGAYGVTFEGRSENLGLFRSVSRFKFDGRGDFRAVEDFSSEATGPKRRSVAGSYRVSNKCVFELLFPSELGRRHEVFGRCVLMANGREFSCLDAEEGWVATGTGVRI